jgi:hypothetical protein
MKLFLFLISILNSANAASFKATYTKVPTTISGTLSPFVVAVDGELVAEGGKERQTLTINGVTFTTKKKEHGPFFFKTESDELSFSDLPEITLPKIEDVSVEEGKVVIQTSSNVTDLFFDKKPLKRNREKRFLVPSAKAKFFESDHIIELRTKDRFSMRIYNLFFEKKEEPPPEKPKESPKPEPPPIVLSNDPFANLGYCVFDSDRRYVHVGGGMNWGARFTASAYLEFGLPDYSEWYHWGFGARTGYQLWRQTTGKNDAIWIEIGISTRLYVIHQNRWEVKARHTFTNYSIPGKRGAFIAGPYLKLEPLRLGSFGMGLSLETDVINTLNQGGAAISLLEVYYHF